MFVLVFPMRLKEILGHFGLDECLIISAFLDFLSQESGL